MKTTRRRMLPLLLLPLLLLPSAAGCGGSGNDAVPEPGAIVENGTVHLGIEDGWLIQGESGRWYKPDTLAAPFQQSDLRVRFRAHDRGPYSSPWGTTATRIELTEIQPL